MDKESLSSKTKSKLDAKESNWKKLKKTLMKSQKEDTQNLNAELKKISKLDFEDFKKAMIDQLKLIDKRMNESELFFAEYVTNILEWTAKNRDMVFETIANSLHERDDLFDKAFEIRDKRLDNLEYFVFVQVIKTLSHIEDSPVSTETKKGISE